MQRAPGLQPRFEPLAAVPARTRARAGFRRAGARAGRALARLGLRRRDAARADRRPASSASRQLEARAVARDLARAPRRGRRAARATSRSCSAATGDFETSTWRRCASAACPFVVERDTDVLPAPRDRRRARAGALRARSARPLALVATLRSLGGRACPTRRWLPLWRAVLPGHDRRVGPDRRDERRARRGAGAAMRAAAAAIAGGPARARPRRAAGRRASPRSPRRSHELRVRASSAIPPARFVERLRTSSRSRPARPRATSARGASRTSIASSAISPRRSRRPAATAPRCSRTCAAPSPTSASTRKAARARPPTTRCTCTTIHRAKGLDFEHVYVLQLHKGVPGDAGRDAHAPLASAAPAAAEYKLCGVPTPGYHACGGRARRGRARTSACASSTSR